MRFWTIRIAMMMVISATFTLAGEQATLQGIESGHFITNAGAQPSTVVTNDFAEGIGPRLGKYTLIAREEINLQTGVVSNGAFVITAANGDTIRGTYSGQASFQAASASWTADGSITGGTGRLVGATGTIHCRRLLRLQHVPSGWCAIGLRICRNQHRNLVLP
jgi:hypothetical protein